MKPVHLILIVFQLILFCSCKKFLNEKPNKSLVVPQTVQDLQALLDNSLFNNASYPFALDIGSDDFYITTADWQSRPASEKNAYIWSADVFNENNTNPWAGTYLIVYNSNLVLDAYKNGEEKLSAIPEAANVKGQALFFRSFTFYTLLQIFAKPYSLDSANIDWGIALRLDADLNKPTTRARVKECYEQLIADTKEAAGLLPVVPLYKTRPCKPAAYALLARTYLSMRDYENAFKYADSCLRLNNTLLDYNALNPSASNPVPLFNDETVFLSTYVPTLTLNLYSKVDSVLFNSYTPNDLRRAVFFNPNADGSFSFKGSYSGSVRPFNGFAVDEMYLTRAECFARMGNASAAMNDLNTLLMKRWKTGTFIPYTAINATDALSKILTERRKELLMRGIRWSDLRRLNKEPQFAKTLIRVIGGQTYFLYPNDKRYVFPIPLQIIQMTGIPQNP